MCVCVCVYIYIHICIHTHTHTRLIQFTPDLRFLGPLKAAEKVRDVGGKLWQKTDHWPLGFDSVWGGGVLQEPECLR